MSYVSRAELSGEVVGLKDDIVTHHTPSSNCVTNSISIDLEFTVGYFRVSVFPCFRVFRVPCLHTIVLLLYVDRSRSVSVCTASSSVIHTIRSLRTSRCFATRVSPSRSTSLSRRVVINNVDRCVILHGVSARKY
jgi:hypothetical protein